MKLAPASGTTPRLANGVRKRASSATSTRSQYGSMVTPSPTATPFTAATRGLGNAASASTKRWKPCPARSSVERPGSARRPISARSWPAQNAPAAPVTTTTAMSGATAASSNASASAW